MSMIMIVAGWLVFNTDHFCPAEFTPDGVLSSLYSYVRTYVRTYLLSEIFSEIFVFLGSSCW